jgi:hypothetical protein
LKAFLLFWLFSTAAFGATVNESDYPNHYRVVVSSKVGGFMIGNFCTLSLRDESAGSPIYSVQRHKHGACRVPDSGTVLQGKHEGEKIFLLVKDDKGETKVEDWKIISTVDPNLSTQ